MALVYIDSFDDIGNTSAQINAKGWMDLNNFMQISTGGRFGTNAMHCPSTSANSRLTLASSYGPTFMCGMAIKSSFTGPAALLGLCDSGSAQVFLWVDASRKVYVTRGDSTDITGPGVTTLADGVFHYFEIKCLLHDSTGTIKVVVDGVTELDLTGLDTKSTANATVNQIQLLRQTAATYYDDLYFCDTTGGAPTNDLLGDVRVECLFPTGNGNSSQLLGSDSNSVDNYLLVDEAAPNDDTDYVGSATVGQKDTYVTGDLTSASGTVYGIQLTPYAKKTDAGTRSLATIARLGGVEVDSATTPLLTAYTYHPDIREAKPGGGVWTVADVNNAEFGVKVAA
jgi:hypothetical protein